jgi:hypothetical protein
MSFGRQGYPLGALFVLVAVCAVLVAGATPLVRMVADGSVEASAFFAALAAGFLSGTTLGVLLGLFQFRLVMGLMMGAGAGAFIGMAAGVMALIPSHEILTAAAAMTAGSGLVVAVAVVMRRVS